MHLGISLAAPSAVGGWYRWRSMTPFNREEWWKWALVGYLALSSLSLLASEGLDKLPEPMVRPLFLLLGPTAWLLWGSPTTLLYMVATMVFAASVFGTVLLRLQTPGIGRLALCLCGFVWLLLGLWAWSLNV